MAYAPVSRIALGLATLMLVVFVRVASASVPARSDHPDEALKALEARSRTGVIYDRVLPLAHLERLDGGPAAPATTLAVWRQAYDELRRASIAPPAGPDLAALDAAVRVSLREGVIPLAIIDKAFERLGPGAPAEDAPLIASRAFAAAALVPRTLRGANLVFALERDRFFSDDPAPPRAVEIDFADGHGFRRVAFGERVGVGYAATGRRTLGARLTRADGSVAEARFVFDVDRLMVPSPDDTIQVTATIPYHGQLGSGEAYVYRAPNHTALVNPVVVVEGFDFDNSMNWDELYELLARENLIETLRADGFDAVVLNFADATDAVQKNGFVVAELLQQVQSLIAPEATLAVVGASMGGLCSRYALAWFESHGMPHRVRTWISLDTPHKGANIPLGLQYWIGFFSEQSVEAGAFLAILQRPAARQMLLYHLRTTLTVPPLTNLPGSAGEPDPMRDTLLVDFAAIGDYPSLPRGVAIANGSGSGQNQGFLPGNQLIRWEYGSLFAAVKGNVWAVPDQTSGTIFNGHLRILFSTTNQTNTVSGTKPWDGAPGGSRASMADLDAVAAPFGDIVALHPAHCFIPTISALALETDDPFFDVAGAPDLLGVTPFDAVYFPTTNQEHVLITPENAVWARNEIEQGVVSVPAPELETVRFSGAPNPFTSSLRLSFTLARPGLVDLRVFGVDGREVRSLFRESRAPGPHGVIWDGRDARGARASAGVYFLRLEAGGSVWTRRVVKLE